MVPRDYKENKVSKENRDYKENRDQLGLTVQDTVLSFQKEITIQ
jgi:hypothetical protein